MAAAQNMILARMLERLFAGLLSGPNLNCRPHSSRQRIDLMQLEKLHDLGPAQILLELLGAQRSVKVIAKVPQPKRVRKNSEKKRIDQDGATSKPPEEREPETELSPEEKAAQKEWSDQQTLLSKLRVLTEEARTYEQDTGVHALNVGFPLLSLPPGSLMSGGSRAASRRVMAPIAFIPITMSIRSGAIPTIEIACKGEGVDLVSPNMGLFAWLEQQTGTAAPDLFTDEKGQDPWREIGGLILHVAKTLKVAVPDSLRDLLASPSRLPQASPMPVQESPAPSALESETESSATNPAASLEPTAIDPEPMVEPLVPELNKLQLEAAPRSDDEEARAAIIPGGVLGLFPMNNQGLLRDMQAMTAGEALDGPVRSFIDVSVCLDEPQETRYDHEAWSGQKRRRSFPDERFVTVSDPCQARAVRLARESRGLVIHGPPGTGKSQTITNVIGDHLARGERVLLVCDKRTALDVVANRMEAMGLRSFCALVYDAQRDQRELYRSMRDQLETLTEARSDEYAATKLARVDAELEKLHCELTEYWSLLAEKDQERGMSFHDVMGRWLGLPEPRGVKLDPTLLKGARGDDFEKNEQDLKDVLARGEEISYGKHPWKSCAQIGLNDFLNNPMDHWREQLALCVDSAKNVDATLDTSILPFAAEPTLEEQAAARLDLARQIESVVQHTPHPVLERWIAQDADTLRRTRKKLADTTPALRLLEEAPIEPELALVNQTERLGLPALSQQLGNRKVLGNRGKVVRLVLF